jgi:uncharacterized protein YrrD
MTDPEQRIDIGADVIGSDGNKVGTVDYIVVRPPQMHITDIVVNVGGLTRRRIVVPEETVSAMKDGRVYLSMNRDRLETYPDYVEVDYRQPPTEWVPPPELYYPPTGILWPTRYYLEPASVRVNAPPGTEGIGHGMEVESSNGHKVGSVDAIESDPASGDVSAFVVKRGFLFTHDTCIPIEHVAGIRDGKVILTLTRDEVQRLEESQSESAG